MRVLHDCGLGTQLAPLAASTRASTRASTARRSTGATPSVELDQDLAGGGANLSAGQRALLSLARALLRLEARLLLVDEATAAVDDDAAASIQQVILSTFKGRTVLAISHRLETLAGYDKLVVIDGGRIKAKNT